MKLAHLVKITPGRCGLYESTHDLVVALRRLGVDSQMLDVGKETTGFYKPGAKEDRGAPFTTLDWAKKADFLVNHSGLGEVLSKEGPPVIHVSHGRPHYSLLLENNSKVPVYSYQYQKSKDPRFKVVITFWPEHKPYLELNWPNTPVRVVPAPVDIERWSPNGPSGYQFGGHKGDINIVCTDGVREDNDPFVPMNAAMLYARHHKGTKFHLYAAPVEKQGWAVMYRKMRDEDCLGEVKPWVTGLDHVFRAADCVLTGVPIATRVVREAMACGCPVAPYTNNMNLEFYTRYIDEQMKTPRDVVRTIACQRYDSIRSALKFKEIADGLG